MKIGELIAELQAAQAVHGDLPVAYTDTECGGYWACTRVMVLPLIDIGNDYWEYAIKPEAGTLVLNIR